MPTESPPVGAARDSSAGYAARTPALKTLRALTWIIDSGLDDVGVREMAAGLETSPSTAHRLLAELLRAGFVVQSVDTGRYALSLEFLRLAYHTVGNAPIRRVALPHMRRLTDSVNESSLLGLYDPSRQQMMFLTMIESSHSLRYSIELNKWLPVHAGSSGLAIMAFLDDAEIDLIIDRTRLAAVTPRTISERYRLKAEVERIREAGYSVTRGQRIPGAVGFAAPIFDAAGAVLGDICLTVPEIRFDEENERGIAELVKACAGDVTRAIGGRRVTP